MRDCHVHFTGSLPREYIFSKFLEYDNKSDLPINMQDIKTLVGFENKLNSYFCSDFEQNKAKFFEIYGFFQKITKPRILSEYPSAYSNGCYEICKNFVRNGLSDFDIIAGPCSNIDLTYIRLKSMIEGIDKAEKYFGHEIGAKIRLTFIRNASGIIKNYSHELLQDIFKMLKEPFFFKRVIGFDISGEEKPKKEYFEENCLILERIIEENKKACLRYDIGIHAGENINNSPEDEVYLQFFEKLKNLDITRICHGTYLWLKINEKKKELLNSFATKNVIFDICPTANIILTPLTNRSQIPVELFKKIGLKYTLNRDNPSIFGNLTTP